MTRYAEHLGQGEERVFTIEEIVYEGDTHFQHVDIIRAQGYGLTLFLNGQRQSSEADEFIYHEMLVHPAMFRHPEPRSVFVIGGGEGATAREILRHRTVDKLIQVDIDGELVELCRQHLPTWNDGAYDDPRLDLVIGDGLAHLRENDDTYDVMIVDVPEYTVDTPAEELYSVDFYRLINQRLGTTGVLGLQVGPVHPVHKEAWSLVAHYLADAFEHALFYNVPELRWGFAVCSTAPLHDIPFDPARVTSNLRYYNPALHNALGPLPAYLAEDLELSDV